MTRGLHAARIDALTDAQRWQDALAELAIYLAQYPDDWRQWCVSARCHIGLREHAAALEAAERAAAIAPDEETPHRLRALALIRLDRRAEAQQAADEAIRIAPELSVAYVARADAGIGTGAGPVDEATRAAAQRALELAPHTALAHNTVGRVALAEKDWRAAEAAFRRALEIAPDDAAARHNLGLSVFRRRRFVAAAGHFMGALRLDPQLPEAAVQVRVLLNAWARLISLVSFFGCLLVFLTGTGHDVTVSDGSVIAVPNPAGGVTYETVSPAVIRHVYQHGHTAVLLAIVGVVLVVVVGCVGTIRTSIGPSAWRLARQAVATDGPTTYQVVVAAANIAVLLIAAAVGMPVAEFMVATLVLLNFWSSIGVIIWRVARRRAVRGRA